MICDSPPFQPFVERRLRTAIKYSDIVIGGIRYGRLDRRWSSYFSHGPRTPNSFTSPGRISG